MAKHKRGAHFLLISLFFFSVSAWAGAVLQMPIGDTGHVWYGIHGRSSAIGAGITISDLVYGTDTLDLLGTRLFFITGKGMGRNGNTLSYGPGGELVVRGCVDTNGNRWCKGKGDVRGILMKGTFLDAKIVNEDGEIIFLAQVLEHLNPTLAAMLNLPTEFTATLDLVLSASGGWRWLQKDNVNGGSLTVLSEPPSIALMGSGLTGLCLILVAKVRREQTVRT